MILSVIHPHCISNLAFFLIQIIVRKYLLILLNICPICRILLFFTYESVTSGCIGLVSHLSSFSSSPLIIENEELEILMYSIIVFGIVKKMTGYLM